MLLADVLKKIGHTVGFGFSDAVSINARNVFGDSPLHVACEWGDIDAVQVLICEGADVDALGEHLMTPIFAAVDGGSEDVIRALLGAGADLSLRETKLLGWITPLSYARLRTPAVAKSVLDLLSRG